MTPLTFLPPSMPRLPQVGAERHERHHHDRRRRVVAAGEPPASQQIEQQGLPQPEPPPAREAGIDRAEWQVRQLARRPPLHAAVADAPDAHDHPVERRLGQRSLRQNRRRAFMIVSCFLTASVNGSTFSNASQETGRTLACPIDDPISSSPGVSSPGVLAHHQRISARRSPPGTPLPYVSKVAPRPSGRRASRLQTGS